MTSIPGMADRLVAEKGFVPAAEVELPVATRIPDIAFLGIREYWGSIMTIGLVDADGLTASEVKTQSAAFYGFTHDLLPFAGRLPIGLANTRLGSFGLLAFVFPRNCPRPVVEAAIGTRHGSAFRKDYAVCWALDVPGGVVHPHRGLPLTMFPGKRYFRRLLVAT